MDEVIRREIEKKHDEINDKFIKIGKEMTELQILMNDFWRSVRK